LPNACAMCDSQQNCSTSKQPHAVWLGNGGVPGPPGRVVQANGGQRLTVIVNGRTVNQVEPINRTKGAVALKSHRGFFPAPAFYRNIVVKPMGAADLEDEKKAMAEFAKVKAAIAQQKAAEKAQLAEEERLQVAAQQGLAKEWADVRQLPDTADARGIRFRSVFGRDAILDSHHPRLPIEDIHNDTVYARARWKSHRDLSLRL